MIQMRIMLLLKWLQGITRHQQGQALRFKEDSDQLDEYLLVLYMFSPDPMPSSSHLSVTMAALGLSDRQGGG